MNMIEKVARAIAVNCGDCKRIGLGPQFEAHIEDAKAAILAMRQPTAFMKEGALTDPGSGGPDEGYETEVWQNMIDNALKEE